MANGRMNPLANAIQNGMAANTTPISSAEAGINTLEDLFALGSAGHSRSDPTLWFVNGQAIRIDPKLYQDYADFGQAFHYSEAHQSGAGMTDEWRQNYLANYNAGTLPPHAQGSSTVGGQTSYMWLSPTGGRLTTPDLTPPPELQGTHWQPGGYKIPQANVGPVLPQSQLASPISGALRPNVTLGSRLHSEYGRGGSALEEALRKARQMRGGY